MATNGRQPALLLLCLAMLATAADTAMAATPGEGTTQAAQSQSLMTFLNPLLVIVTAVLGAGGFRFFLEPYLKRRRLRKVMATGLWLSCSELRRHLEAIKGTILHDDEAARQTRDAMLKRPRSDFNKRVDWFVKTGHFCMITAYRIAAFSAWMRIYQTSVLQALFTPPWSHFISEIFTKFDAFKVAASENTVLWYSYIDAIGERIVVTDGELKSPLDFSAFCMKYNDDEKFMLFFDQLHMFIHFMGKAGPESSDKYYNALNEMIKALDEIECFLAGSKENLLAGYKPMDRRRTSSPELVRQQVEAVPE